MNKAVILLLSLLLFNSCDKKIVKVKNEGIVAADSTLFCRQDSIIKIQIGDQLIPKPLVSQFIENNNGNMFYVILDENTLHWFDVKTNKLLRTNKINNCGNLNNYSGFLCKGDTTFVYNYTQKMVYMLDSSFKTIRYWNVVNGDSNKNTFDPEALTDSPILYFQDRIILSGTKLGLFKKDEKKHSVSCNINISNNNIIYGVNYPEQYLEGDFGGVYFNTIYHVLGDGNNCIYSFPADHYVYSYSTDFSSYRKFYMGSRYTPSINSSDYNSLELIKDKDLRIKYFISQHSYSNLLYDPYRKVYYRIAQHPLIGWERGAFPKPFSIIVMDINGDLISETPIQTNYEELNLHNMHVTKDGLLIQINTQDENVIEFALFKLLTYEK